MQPHEIFTLDLSTYSMTPSLVVMICISLAAFTKRPKPGMRCHDDWCFCWTVGRCQLQQQGEVHLQEASRGCTCDNGPTHHHPLELPARVDPRWQEERLLQSRTNRTNGKMV